MEEASPNKSAVILCKGCGRKMFWGETLEGKKIPLDASAPVYRFVVAKEVGKEPLKSNIVERVECFVSHFSTCSKASDFSKRGR